jgi:protein TonB
MIGQGGGQTAIVLTLGALLVVLLILFAAMAINDQKSRLKQLAADAQAAVNPPASAPIPASTAPAAPPSLPQAPRRFPLAEAGDADRVAPKAEPAGTPALWFSNDDYPAEARRRNEEGRVKVRVKIDRHGVPRACGIVSSSGSTILDDATCDLAMRRGRFVPAQGANGKAVWGSWTAAIRWQITDEP